VLESEYGRLLVLEYPHLTTFHIWALAIFEDINLDKSRCSYSLKTENLVLKMMMFVAFYGKRISELHV